MKPIVLFPSSSSGCIAPRARGGNSLELETDVDVLRFHSLHQNKLTNLKSAPKFQNSEFQIDSLLLIGCLDEPIVFFINVQALPAQGLTGKT